jgi:CubicO group peptidase (beta-lactamase class C family)
MRWLPALVVAATFAASADNVDDYVEAERARQRIPGLSIAVTRDGEIVKAQGYGFANVEHGVPATAETVYQSGSVGKQFTAALVMMLVAEGQLGLDDPLVEHLGGAPDAWSSISIRQMLNHTAGLSNAVYEKLDLRRDYTDDELVREISSLPLEFAPGERWAYSNSGYVLLGILIGRVTGRFYGDMLAEKIFAPLGMTTARMIDEAAIVPNRAAGYALVGGELQNQAWVSPTFNRTADGALYLTVRDLAKWDAALRTDRLLDGPARELMWTPAALADGGSAPYGFGWELAAPGGHRVVRHGGRWQGFSSHIARYVDVGVSVIVLTNLANASPGRIASGIAGLVDPDLAPVKRTAVPLDPAVLDTYVGRYEFAPGAGLAVTRDAGALWLTPDGQPKAQLFAFAPAEFFVEIAEVEFEFVKDAAGRVTHLLLKRGGNADEARKVD